MSEGDFGSLSKEDERRLNCAIQAVASRKEIDDAMEKYLVKKRNMNAFIATAGVAAARRLIATGRFDAGPTVRRNTMIELLKSLVVAKYNVEELVAFRAQARLLAQEFMTQTLQVPLWLTDVEESLDEEVKLRARDEKLCRLNEIKTRRAALATLEKKRQAFDAEIAALEESLK
jgi:hypothetical protein